LGLLTLYGNLALVPALASSTAQKKINIIIKIFFFAPSYIARLRQPMSNSNLIKLITLLLFFMPFKMAQGQTTYQLKIIAVDSAASNYIKTYIASNVLKTDSLEINKTLEDFLNQAKQRGYIGASIDAYKIAPPYIELNFYAGQQVNKLNITINKADQAYINLLIKNNVLSINPMLWDSLSQNILVNLANAGYPFANVQLKNFGIDSAANAIAQMQINQNIKYKIDSLVFDDTLNIISKSFLQKYLGLNKTTYYSNNLLQNISAKIKNLPYLTLVNEPQLNLLNTGAYINLNLKSKSANSINALLGLVPNINTVPIGAPTAPIKNNYSLIGQANIKLWNLLGGGEFLSLQFEQLIAKHPRLHIETKMPYIFKTNFPFNFVFDLYRRDTLFLNLMASASTSVATGKNSLLSLGLQWAQTNTVGLNLNNILITKQLPNYIDSRFYGLLMQYDYKNLSNIFYPINKGSLAVNFSGGTRVVKKNSEILNLKDPLNPGFSFAKLYDTVANNAPQIKWTAYLQHYIGLKKLKVLKCAIRVGALVSNNVFFNEQFLLGGIKTLRGFDEESQPASLFSIGTLEYRIPAGSKAFFAFFTDAAWMRNSTLNSSKSILFGSAGAGITINGKAGVLNFTIANGVRTNDVFDFRRTKVHINYEVVF
jgi:hypothetical protein